MLVTVEDGRAVPWTGDPEHPITAGFLCGKVSNYLDRVYAPDRLLHPLVRDGAKGEGRFRRGLLGRGARSRGAASSAGCATSTAARRSCPTATPARRA